MESNVLETPRKEPCRVASYIEKLYQQPLKSFFTVVCFIGACQGTIRLGMTWFRTATLIDVRVRVPKDYLELPQIAICQDLPITFKSPDRHRGPEIESSFLNSSFSNACREVLPQCFISHNRNFDCCLYATEVRTLQDRECFVFHTLPFGGRQATPGSNAGFQVLVRLGSSASRARSALVAIAEKIPDPLSFKGRNELQLASVMPNKSYFFQLIASYENDCEEQSTCPVSCDELSEANAESSTAAGNCGPNTCRSSCFNWKYDLSASYVDLQLARVENLIYYGSNDTGHFGPPPSYALIRVFYSTLFYLERLQIQPVTGHTIISQAGGVVAIWLGASVMGMGKMLIDWLGTWKTGIKVVRKGVGIV